MIAAKTILQCALCAILCGLCAKAYLAIGQAQESIKSVSVQATGAISAMREYAVDARAQLNSPQVQRGIGLLLRSGDDLARTIKKTNVVLDNLNDAIQTTNRNLNDRVLPDISGSIVRSAEAISTQIVPEVARAAGEAADAVKFTTSALEEGMGAATRSLEQIERRVADPKIDSILSNVEAGTDHANKTLGNVEMKTDQLIRPAHWLWRGIKAAAEIVGRIFF